jgi:hypothetical protein
MFPLFPVNLNPFMPAFLLEGLEQFFLLIISRKISLKQMNKKTVWKKLMFFQNTEHPLNQFSVIFMLKNSSLEDS